MKTNEGRINCPSCKSKNGSFCEWLVNGQRAPPRQGMALRQLHPPPPPTKRGLTPSEALGSNYCSIVKGTANLLGHGSA